MMHFVDLPLHAAHNPSSSQRQERPEVISYGPVALVNQMSSEEANEIAMSTAS